MPGLDPPPQLTAAARQIWIDTIKQVMEAGRIDRLDPNSLASYVSAVATHRRATELLAASDVLIDKDGAPVANPALAVIDQAARTIAAFARQFRLNASRAPEQPSPQVSPPMRDAEPMRAGRWCERHNRYCCTGKRADGGDCCRPARKTSGKCPRHDVRSKAVKLAENLIREPTYGTPVKVTPEQALLGELWRTAGHVKWLGERVAALEAEALTFGTTEIRTDQTGDNPGQVIIQKAGPAALLDLYDRERKHLVHVAAEIIRAGLGRALVDLAREQGAMFGRAVELILSDLSLTAEQQSLVAEVVPRRFRELLPGEAAS